ncbi:MAG: phenylalanine--tRNA ligase subunit beta, partial [Eubacteriaceae bacterium]|nr:phenylalanine--tRNA ligase subunit beta [Eubacteriaceae bacterium]
MLVSYNWLKEYVGIKMNVNEFGDILTMSGTKVESITPISDQERGIITGKIIEINQHPNADKLVICDVDFGEKGIIPIITSATNVYKGAVVPVALDGAVLADGTKMTTTTFRGVASQGMMCSVEEMGMNKNLFSKEILNGIYILPPDTELGIEVRTLFWIDDQIIDVELTANRSDCQSMYGIAREAAAALNESISPIALYDPKKEGKNEIDQFLQVGVESHLCPRYIARMFKVKKIEPSPIWMQRKLINCGVRPINNIVDITNYVMLEMGQPLHAFDYKSLQSNRIVVKRVKNQSFMTLDDTERNIDHSMLMITNGEKPVAIAGIMGGQNSEITNQTEYIVLESACFDKTSIRQTSRKIGLRTEASARFEKGLYPNLAETAALRATYLLEKIGACDIIPGTIDIYHQPLEPRTVTVDCEWINHFIGIHLSEGEMIKILQRLFLQVELCGSGKMIISIPDYRQDLTIPEDIAEEIARIYGYDKIPNTIMSGATLVGVKTDEQKYQDKIENMLIGTGFYQTMTTSFSSEKRIRMMNLFDQEEQIKIINPLGEENSVMRNTLAGQQLETISLNYNRKNNEGCFFEIAKTYHVNPDSNKLPIEIKHLVLSEYGPCNFYDIKGTVEMLFKNSGIDVRYNKGGSGLFHPGRSAVITVNGVEIGQIGEIHPMVVKKFSLPKRVYLAELDFDQMISLRKI